MGPPLVGSKLPANGCSFRSIFWPPATMGRWDLTGDCRGPRSMIDFLAESGDDTGMMACSHGDAVSEGFGHCLPPEIALERWPISVDPCPVHSGTAGNVVANRLTEDSAVRVLVIEAGMTNKGVEDSIVPFLCTSLSPDTPWTWNYTTTPQVALDGRSIPYPRGRLLGGSSSINFMVYTRGSSEDFDRYANQEHFVPPADHHNTSGQFDPAVHGFSGPVQVSLPGFPQAIDGRVVETTRELEEFSWNQDMNSGFTLGIGWTQATIGSSRRSSSAMGYLAPHYLKRANLDVLINTRVTKLVPADDETETMSFNSVELAQSSAGPFYRISADKEIVLSAGSINTPQLLMLSGLGDPAVLQRLGIRPLVDLPDVGKNLQDHPLIPSQFFVNGTDTSDTFKRNATLFSEIFTQYNMSGSGPLVASLFNNIGWLRIPDNSSIYQNYSDPAAGPQSAHYELIFSNGFAGFVQPIPSTGHYLSVLTSVTAPMSRGSVTLNSSDPFDSPVIDPGLLNHPWDITSAWDGYVLAQYGEGAYANTDAELEQYACNFTSSVYHPVSTASMTSVDATGGGADFLLARLV
ncbi:hypothetical protein EW146_g6493 [Bondarzewia mesenterica]|uniref:Glucose-methanol-choline oxidoreductase N-terminal domain-containing protein n=1 Tax=Bondarzewia mesenterica TaxID=1095465 RepID=A0A4S4LNI6_9AGAM|nr:hypothetical protein EW146_g6493 [Bondarzewia mesenterica]